jgi:hypothetical protein
MVLPQLPISSGLATPMTRWDEPTLTRQMLPMQLLVPVDPTVFPSFPSF